MEVAAAGSVVSSLVKMGLSMVEIITRRMAIKATSYAADHIDEHRQTLLDINKTIEKETTLILQALNSQQEAKLKSAYDHIESALLDLRQWSLEGDAFANPTASSDQSSITVLPNAEAISESVAVKLVSTQDFHSVAYSSDYFKWAMQHIYDADGLAMNVFNDRKNSDGYMRIDALHLRIFCATMRNWENRKYWFETWKSILTKLFNDDDLFRLALGQQSWLSEKISNEKAELISKRFYSLLESLNDTIFRMIMNDTTLIAPARELISWIDKNIEIKQKTSNKTTFPGLRFDFVKFIIYNHCVKDFCIVQQSKPNTSFDIIAIDHNNRLVAGSEYFLTNEIEQRFPDLKPEVFSADKHLLSIAYAGKTKTIYVLYKTDTDLYVLNTRSGQTDKIPNRAIESDNYRLRCTPDETLLVSKNDGEKQFVKFAMENTERWFILPDGDRKNYQIIFDLYTMIIGMAIFYRNGDNYVITDYMSPGMQGKIKIRKSQKILLNSKNKPSQWIISPRIHRFNISCLKSDVYAIGYDDNSVCAATVHIKCYEDKNGVYDHFGIHAVEEFDIN